ncbi:hypothetical protein FQN53_003832 [Emmonsiellopsis sp. PD_33]|nr:hypothetical protein FQN53_003832 [Emmonsiellopsis sp. PD_33]
MRVLCIQSQCASYEKRDRFLSLLSDIGAFTHENEPRTIAYSWFKSTGDDPEFPNHHLRGFEVYEDEHASKVTHRSSEPYKKMRSIVGPEGILEKPTDLSYCQPTGIGFLTRPDHGVTVFQGIAKETQAERSHIEVVNIQPKPGMKPEILQGIKALAAQIETEAGNGILSFWCLEFLPEYANDGIILFSRYEDRNAYLRHLDSREKEPTMANISLKSDTLSASLWEESSIGFIGRTSSS